MSKWIRTEFTSIWQGPDLELVVVSPPRTEDWQWTCIGWRSPDDCDNADNDGWVRALCREDAEKEALAFYLEKDE